MEKNKVADLPDLPVIETRTVRHRGGNISRQIAEI